MRRHRGSTRGGTAAVVGPLRPAAARRVAVLAAAAASLIAAAPAPALAAEGWVAARSALPSGGESTRTEVAVDGRGRHVVLVATQARPESRTELSVVDRRGAGFAAPVAIGAVAGHLNSARLVAGASGDVAALWGAWDLEQRRFRWWVAVRPAGAASFGAPEEVPTGPTDALDADAALDAAGTLTVTWTSAERVAAPLPTWRNRVRVVVRAPGGGFGPVEDVSAPDAQAFAPRVAAGEGGAVIVWTVAGDHGGIALARRAPDAMAWTPAARVPRSSVSAREPRIGVDARGDALVAWLARDGRRYRVRAVRQRASGRFGTTRTLSRGGAGEHAVAVSSRGRAAVAWRRSDGRASRVEAAVGASGRRFSSARSLSATGPAPLEPAVGIGDGGLAMVVWSRFDRDRARVRVEAAVRRGARGFGAPSALSSTASPRGGRPSVAVSASGRALAVWDPARSPRSRLARLPAAGWRLLAR